MPYFQGGMAYYPPPAAAPGDPANQQPAVYQRKFSIEAGTSLSKVSSSLFSAPSVYPAQSGPPQTATYPPVMFPAQPVYVPQHYTVPVPVSTLSRMFLVTFHDLHESAPMFFVIIFEPSNIYAS